MRYEYTMDLGIWDGFFAKRLMARGPKEVVRMYDGKYPLFNAVVQYKWRQDPCVKAMLQMSRILRFVQCFDPAHYALYRAGTDKAVKYIVGADEDAYQQFMMIIDNPRATRQRILQNIFEQNPKMGAAVEKIYSRTEELEKLGLPFDADYCARGSKHLDKIKLGFTFGVGVCKYDSQFLFDYIKAAWQQVNDVARMNVANVLFAENSSIRYNFEANARYSAKATQIYKEALMKSVQDSKDIFEQRYGAIEERYRGLEKYKQMIADRQLSEFVKS